MTNLPWVKSYCGGKPNYCTPEVTPEATTQVTTEVTTEVTGDVDAVNMSQERVDETAKGEHEPVAWRTFDGEGNYEYRDYDMNENYAKEWAERNPNHAHWVEPLFVKEPPKRDRLDAAVLAERKRIVDLLMIQHEAVKGRHNYWAVAANLIQADVPK